MRRRPELGDLVSVRIAALEDAGGSSELARCRIGDGTLLPSVEAIDQSTRAHTSLRIADRLPFGAHYAETLRRWDTAFLDNRDRVLELGFDETFIRMWHFYLEYSRAGFASGRSTHANRLSTIRMVWEKYGTMIDTHTADGVKVGLEHRESGVPLGFGVITADTLATSSRLR